MRMAIKKAFAEYTQVNQTHPVQRFVKLYHGIANNPNAEFEKLPEPVKEQKLEADREVIEFRPLKPGMGQAVAERTILRRKADGSWETWGDVATRVALGNASLKGTHRHPSKKEFKLLPKHIANGTTLMSGGHLQHGDADQPNCPMEVFTNCGHADTAFLTVGHGVTTLGQCVGKTVTVRCVDGEWRPAEGKKYGEQMLYTLRFRKVGPGPALYRTERFTRNHRWLLSDGTVTEDIKNGDELVSLPEALALDRQAVVHGLVFGDGSAHKQRHDHHIRNSCTWVSATCPTSG